MKRKPFRYRTFMGFLLVLLVLSVYGISSPKPDVLIIQDERPQMEVLAKFLREQVNANITIVEQKTMPLDLSGYDAVIVFIHKSLQEKTETAIIDYTKKGGKLICLHHSISSIKARNKYYYDFLGMQLDKGDMESGGYKWIAGSWTLVNLHSQHYITNHKIQWEKSISYMPGDTPSVERNYPAIELKKDSEVFVNHKFKDGREKTVLCGLVYTDKQTGKVYMQDRSGWLKQQGKGIVVYFMPGHSKSDYENKNVAQIILNAIRWNPKS